MLNKYILIILLQIFNYYIFAQNTDSVNTFNYARQMAFSGKTEIAKNICLQILYDNPLDIQTRLLLANIYAWNRNYDSSRIEIIKILAHENNNYEARSISFNIDYWNDSYNQAFNTINENLKLFPSDSAFTEKKALVLEKLEKYNDAIYIWDSLRLKYNNNRIYEQHIIRLQKLKRKHRIGFYYDYEYANTTYIRSAHIQGIEMLLNTKYGDFVPRFNIGQQASNISEFYNKNDYQLEFDLYPKINIRNYLYINYGYSFDELNMFFPNNRAGLELYHNFQKKLEASVGFRYLDFNTDIFIFTGSIGYYYKSFWFSIRPYIASVPIGWTKSMCVTGKWYYKEKQDFIAIELSSGSSPDVASQVSGFMSATDLKNYRINFMFQNRQQKILFLGKLGVGYQEYIKNKYSMVLNCGIAISYCF